MTKATSLTQETTAALKASTAKESTTIEDQRKLLPCGDAAVLVELPDLEAVLALYRGLGLHQGLDAAPEGVLDVVPAARTILVTFDPARLQLESVKTWLRNAEAETSAPVQSQGSVEIPVHYDGPDLEEAAQFLGLSPAELVELHSGSTWTAAFTGFAPGFAYLVTDHERLKIPRRNTPRTAVPAGSVALGGEFSAVYPSSSPGGWQLIGRTDIELWDPRRAENPALIVPGAKIRFYPL